MFERCGLYESMDIGYRNFAVVVVVVDGRMTSLPPKRGKGKRRKVASLGTIFCQVSPWPLGTSFFLSPASACLLVYLSACQCLKKRLKVKITPQSTLV